MRIGIDARFLTHPQVGGFKTYSTNLVSALSQVDQTNNYIVYLDRPPADGTLPQKDNFTYRIVEGSLPVFGMPVREQIRLPMHIDRDRPDVVHYLCNTAPVRARGKFVVTLHDTIQVTCPQTFRLIRNPAKHKLWAMMAYSKWTISSSIHSATQIITVSNYEKDQIIRQLQVAPQRVCVTYLAANPKFVPVDLETAEAWRTELHDKYVLPNKYILGIGYEKRKNIPLLLEAFSRVAPGQPDLDLVIVAAEEGSRLRYQNMTDKNELTDRVVVLPAIPAEVLVKLYNLAQVFVYPSERESFGLPPLEAMACGTPTIAMNMTSLPEILADGAILVDGKDVETWANAIRHVLVNEDVRRDLILRGRKQADKLTWERCAQKTVEIYHDVVKRAG